MLWQGGAGGGNADPYFYGKFNWSAAMENEHPVNKNRIEHFPSRPAKDLFADFTNRLMTLEWIPFNTYGPRIFSKGDSPEYQDLKLMFETYGWPGELDGEGFDAASRRWKEFNRVRSDAKQLMNKVEELEKEIIGLRQRIDKTLEGRTDGVWDEQVAKTPEEVAEMEHRLQMWQENIEWLEEQKVEAEEEAAGVTNEDEALEKGWENHIKNGIERKQRDLHWCQNDGAQYATEAKIQDLIAGIKALEERVKDIKALPKTSFDAIKKQKDQDWLCCK